MRPPVIRHPPAAAHPCPQPRREKSHRSECEPRAPTIEAPVQSAQRQHAVDHRLIAGTAHRAVIDDGIRRHAHRPAAIDEAPPFRAALLGEMVGKLGDQHFFRSAVADLLAQEGADRWPPPVPDECPRREAEPVSGIAQAPAEIHIVPGGVEPFLSPPDCNRADAPPPRHRASHDSARRVPRKPPPRAMIAAVAAGSAHRRRQSARRRKPGRGAAATRGPARNRHR